MGRRRSTNAEHHDIGVDGSAIIESNPLDTPGSLDAREMRVLREAGEVLGLTRQEVAKYLQRFW